MKLLLGLVIPTVYSAMLETGMTVETECLGMLKIVRQIGKGRSAQVFQATRIGDPAITVAIKAGASTEELATEAQVLEALNGEPGFPSYLCSGDGFLVMEFMSEYKSLDKFRESREPLPMSIEDIAITLIDRLEAVHRAGYVHVDVHKRNIMVKTTSPSDVVLLDFGLAVPLREPKKSHQVNLFLSSVHEQARQPLQPIDDIERLMFVLLHYAYGPLPWALTAEMHMEIVRNEEILREEVSQLLHSLNQRIFQGKLSLIFGQDVEYFETYNVPKNFRRIFKYIAQSRAMRDSMSFSVDYRLLKSFIREGQDDLLPVRQLGEGIVDGSSFPSLLPVDPRM
jgi:serine/threonine protein kinase